MATQTVSRLRAALKTDAVRGDLAELFRWTAALVVSEILRADADAESDPRVARRLRQIADEIGKGDIGDE